MTPVSIAWPDNLHTSLFQTSFNFNKEGEYVSRLYIFFNILVSTNDVKTYYFGGTEPLLRESDYHLIT